MGQQGKWLLNATVNRWEQRKEITVLAAKMCFRSTEWVYLKSWHQQEIEFLYVTILVFLLHNVQLQDVIWQCTSIMRTTYLSRYIIQETSNDQTFLYRWLPTGFFHIGVNYHLTYSLKIKKHVGWNFPIMKKNCK